MLCIYLVFFFPLNIYKWNDNTISLQIYSWTPKCVRFILNLKQNLFFQIKNDNSYNYTIIYITRYIVWNYILSTNNKEIWLQIMIDVINFFYNLIYLNDFQQLCYAYSLNVVMLWSFSLSYTVTVIRKSMN